LTFSAQTRLLAATEYKPFDLNHALADHLVAQTGASVDVRAPAQIVSLVVAHLPANLLRHLEDPQAPMPARQSHTLLCALAGLSRPAHNLSDWAGGMHRFAREEGQVSRAEFKLLEAFAVFGIDLPPRGRALDLGASPGGWTRVLRQRGQYVTAIDPGDLDPRLLSDSGIRHMRMTAEAYRRSDPDQYDIIVNDMRMDSRDSARLMVAYAAALYRHGQVIMTLKLPEQHRRPMIDQALAILREAFTIAGARQLFHNRSEITLWLRPRR
jgi:23S rRNA (cytidine2498-2'-O)-methyltransferase